MKNYKSILFTSLSIIAFTNSHITQAYRWPGFLSWFNSSPRSPYEDYLMQLRHDLQGIPTNDIDSIILLARKKLTIKRPENDYHINQLMRDAIIDHIRIITIDMAKQYTDNSEEIDASVRSMVGNVKARLNRGENLNGLALAQFFDRESLKKLVLQNVKNPYTMQTTYKPAIHVPISSPSHNLIPINPSPSTTYHPSNDDFLHQTRHDLKGVPEHDINAIIATVRQEFLQKKPTNDYNKNNIVREAITNRIRMNARFIASQLTNNETLIDNTVQSMSGNVKARLSRGDNLNGQALQQFFGSNLERIVKQNIDAHNAQNTNPPVPLPTQYAPSAPSIPSAPTQKTIECCICLEDFEKTALQNIPCINLHTDQICPACASELTTCPLCREQLIK